MRITFVIPNANLAGGTRVIAIYAERLKKRGHQVTVVSAPRKKQRLRRRVKSFLLGRGWPLSPRQSTSFLDGLDVEHRVIDRWRPITDADVADADVVIATWWETAEWVAALSPGKGAKAYFVQGHEVFPRQPHDRVRATYSLPLHKITISNWLARLMHETYGDADVSLVPNSVDTQQFHAPVRGKQRVPTVGLLYSLSSVKGCDVSIEAFGVARQKLPGLRMAAFGLDEPGSELLLPEGTTYTKQPPQESIRDIYSQCDVWLCGSRTEGFHLPPLEAMACRCPVVSTRVGGPVDVIEDGVNGYLVDIEDAEGLADRLVRVLTLPDAEWRAMSDAAYATATRYTWDDATILFERALLTAIGREKRGDFSSSVGTEQTLQ